LKSGAVTRGIHWIDPQGLFTLDLASDVATAASVNPFRSDRQAIPERGAAAYCFISIRDFMIRLPPGHVISIDRARSRGLSRLYC
jgi:hypothetical protein